MGAALKLGDLNLCLPPSRGERAIEERCLSGNQNIKLEGCIANFLINNSGNCFV